MIRLLLALVLLAVPASLRAQDAPSQAGDAPFLSYTFEFDRFVETTRRMKDGPRVALFRKRFNALLPGFYQPSGGESRAYDARVLAALRDYPTIRTRYLATAQAFGAALMAGGEHFRRFFPDYHRDVPVYLVHSLGEMDGGLREFGGQRMLIFGADVLARTHDAASIRPLLDHELFHSYHVAYFADCPALWCSVWSEGLATFAAAQMNPGASDRQLLLTQPVPLRAAVDPHFDAAMCLLKARLDSTEDADHRAFLQLGGGTGQFPGRFGYYLGYRIAAQMSRTMSLAQLAHLDASEARPRIQRAIEKLAPHCPRTEE
jgi:hypothetical protein